MELEILNAIQGLRIPALDHVMVFITKLGDGSIVWLAAALVLLLIPKTRRCGAAMAVGLMLELLCCNAVLKPLAARVRPCDVNRSVTLLIVRPADYSFPSGHTGASFAAVAALYFGKNRLWLPGLVLACLIAFSRVYLYVHYPTDILAGIALGILTGWAGERAVRIARQQHWHIGGRAADEQTK